MIFNYDFESLIIYGFLMIFLVLCGDTSYSMSQSKLRIQRHESFIPILIGITIYSVIFGCRYNVGKDHLSYLEGFTNITSTYLYRNDIEVGWLMFTSYIAKTGAHFSVYFFLIAFIQILFIYITVKQTPQLYPFIGFVYMSGSFLTLMNGMRQFTVFPIMCCCIAYAKSLKFIHFLIIIFICTSIHTSSIIFIPLLFYIKYGKDTTKSVKLQLFIILLMILINRLGLLSDQLAFIKDISAVIGYEKYSKIDLSSQINDDFNWGPRSLLMILITILTIFFSKQTKDYYKYHNNYIILYNLWFWGTAIGIIFIDNDAFRRICEYFSLISIFIYSFTIYYLYTKRKTNLVNQLCFISYIGVNILIFIGTLYAGTIPSNCATFRFYFEN